MVQNKDSITKVIKLYFGITIFYTFGEKLELQTHDLYEICKQTKEIKIIIWYEHAYKRKINKKIFQIVQIRNANKTIFWKSHNLETA